jgi:aspartate kinase
MSVDAIAQEVLTSIVVMKFGGSSLADDSLRELAVARLRTALADGKRPVAVISAIGRMPDPYSTDALLSLPEAAPHGANRDFLLACGEMISAALLAARLEADGIPARAVTGWQAGIVTDANHGDARIVSLDISLLLRVLADGAVPVVCGFQGATADGTITTLGRGGSDLTAIALAKAFGNAPVDIFTDVQGVMTADPKRVPGARTASAITFEEVTELAQAGASVVHDKAAELARLDHIRFAVLSLRSGKGTTIGRAVQASDAPVTGIATSFGHTFLHVIPEAAVLPGGWEEDAFRVLAERAISIDCVNVNAAGLFFIVRDTDLERALEGLESLPLAVRIRRDCAKISLVGAAMRGTPGVMYAAVRTLCSAAVPIIHSTDSNITISLLVPAARAAAAEAALHEHFALGVRPEQDR